MFLQKPGDLFQTSKHVQGHVRGVGNQKYSVILLEILFIFSGSLSSMSPFVGWFN
jgi:hypothetical protein